MACANRKSASRLTQVLRRRVKSETEFCTFTQAKTGEQSLHREVVLPFLGGIKLITDYWGETNLIVRPACRQFVSHMFEQTTIAVRCGFFSKCSAQSIGLSCDRYFRVADAKTAVERRVIQQIERKKSFFVAKNTAIGCGQSLALFQIVHDFRKRAQLHGNIQEIVQGKIMNGDTGVVKRQFLVRPFELNGPKRFDKDETVRNPRKPFCKLHPSATRMLTPHQAILTCAQGTSQLSGGRDGILVRPPPFLLGCLRRRIFLALL